MFRLENATEENIFARLYADSLDMTMQNSPIQASQLMRPRVRMLPKMKPMAAATATNTAVHVACEEIALRPMEIPSMPDPAMKIQSRKRKSVNIGLHDALKGGQKLLTNNKDNAEDFITDTMKHQLGRIVEAIHLGVALFECSNDVSRPTRQQGYSDQGDHARDQAQLIKRSWNGQNAETNLSLGHESDGTEQSDLSQRALVHAGRIGTSGMLTLR